MLHLVRLPPLRRLLLCFCVVLILHAPFLLTIPNPTKHFFQTFVHHTARLHFMRVPLFRRVKPALAACAHAACLTPMALSGVFAGKWIRPAIRWASHTHFLEVVVHNMLRDAEPGFGESGRLLAVAKRAGMGRAPLLLQMHHYVAQDCFIRQAFRTPGPVTLLRYYFSITR